MGRLFLLTGLLALSACTDHAPAVDPDEVYTFEPGHYDPDRIPGMAEMDAAAARGDTAAQFRVALHRHTMTRQYETARVVFERLAAEGHRPSMEMLAWFHRDGKGVPVDHAQAAQWMARAAALGSVPAARDLAAYRAHRSADARPGSATTGTDS